MSLFRRVLRRLFPPPPPIARYIAGGRVPWSDGYMEYKMAAVAGALAAPGVISCFFGDKPLPSGYGIGIDERCVEYPWVFARLSPGDGRLLDAGSALNHAELVGQQQLQGKKLHIVTLAPEHQSFWDQGISYLYEDLRRLPIRDATYDTVVCISTLEHIGMDNRAFGGAASPQGDHPGDYLLAPAELRRVLRPGGTLLLTVPFGRYADLGTQQVFDAKMVNALVAAFGAAMLEESYFRYTANGWERSTPDACAGSEYVPWIALPPEDRRGRFPPQPDAAAAARAVACLRLVKQ